MSGIFDFGAGGADGLAAAAAAAFCGLGGSAVVGAIEAG